MAESRGSEMNEVLNSAMTGHPIITTLHSLNAESMIDRMVSMVMMDNKAMAYEDIRKDIEYHFRVYIYLKRNIDEKGIVNRYISSIAYLSKSKFITLYKSDGVNEFYNSLNYDIYLDLKITNPSSEFKSIYLNEVKL